MPDEDFLLEDEWKQGYHIKIYIDPDPLDPRAHYDQMGTMWCFHKRALLGDEHDLNRDQFNSYEEIEQHIWEHEDPEIIMTLYLYQHSGMTISTTPFRSRWDSGQVGFIFATEEDILENFQADEMTDELREKAREVLKGEVENYAAYISGEVYGYKIVEEHDCPKCGARHEETVDSCWNFHEKDNLREHVDAYFED